MSPPNGAGRRPEGERPAETTDITAATAVCYALRIAAAGPAGASDAVEPAAVLGVAA